MRQLYPDAELRKSYYRCFNGPITQKIQQFHSDDVIVAVRGQGYRFDVNG